MSYYSTGRSSNVSIYSVFVTLINVQSTLKRHITGKYRQFSIGNKLCEISEKCHITGGNWLKMKKTLVDLPTLSVEIN